MYIGTSSADTAPLLFPRPSPIAASRVATWQILLRALQITGKHCYNVANAHNVVAMSSQSVRKSNPQIGSLQIDVHEPAVRLSQAVISIEEGDRRPKLVWKPV